MSKMRIRYKVAIMVTFWMFWLSLLGLYSIKMSSNALEESYGQNMVSIANVMNGTLAIIIANKIETLQNLEVRPVITTPLKKSNHQFSAIEERELFISTNDRIWIDFISLLSKEKPSKDKKNVIINQLIKDTLDNETSAILKNMFFLFYEKHQGRTVFSKIYLTNSFGVIIAATSLTDDYYHGDEEWWQEAVKKGVYISEIEHEKAVEEILLNSDVSQLNLESNPENSGYGLTIAVRLNDEKNNFIGVVKAVLSSRWLMREVQAVTDRHEYTDIKLVTQDGKLIYSNKPFNFFDDVSDNIFFKASLLSKNNLMEYKQDLTAHEHNNLISQDIDKKMSGYFIIEEGGVNKLYAHSHTKDHTHIKGTHLLPIENINWCIFIGNPVNHLLAAISILQKKMIFVYLGVMLLSIIVGMFVAKKYAQAIINLRDAAFAVAGGDFNKSVNVKLKDEIGDLANSFNIMTLRLKKSYETLNREISIRKKAEQRAEYALKESESALQETEYARKQAEFESQKAEYSRQEAEAALQKAEESRQEAETARKEAESANRAKSNFLANMSHELRTPLNAIIGFSQLMERDKDVTESQRETVNIIMRSGMHLLNLINDILEMSKIEAGKIEVQYEEFDFFQMIQDIVAMTQSRAVSKGLELLVDIDPSIPQYIKSDQQKLRQVIINLLVNAVKFTKYGSVALKIRCQGCSLGEEMPPKRGTIFFEIQDTGIGISKDDIKNLFKKFMRTRTSLSSSVEGTGLGLSISQEYVRLMGGDITVESEVDKGSIFKFSIDAQTASDSTTKNNKHLHNSKVITVKLSEKGKFKILIVDDNLENQILLSKLLLSVGFDVRTASNGLEGVEIFQSWNPHLIWMDMRMPVMDGYEACRKIRQIENQKNRDKITIIALTASAFEEQKELVLTAGCDDFIRKPFLESEIFNAIEKYLGVKYIYESSDRYNPLDLTEHLQDHGRNNLNASLICSFTTNTDKDNLYKETLPQNFILDMKQALIDLDLEKINTLIDDIAVKHPDSARYISKLASDFKYSEIMEVLDKIK